MIFIYTNAFSTVDTWVVRVANIEEELVAKFAEENPQLIYFFGEIVSPEDAQFLMWAGSPSCKLD